jgi:xanthine dehydrogenase YagT iron-sulfur-binding subunit
MSDHDLSRRDFLKGFGAIALAGTQAAAGAVAAELEKRAPDNVVGPGPVPVTLDVNGQRLKFQLEPRVTLLDALRNHTALTGCKEVCDRATCGACTVLFDGAPVYACMKLAIESQGHAITTVEGIAKGSELSAVQKAIIEADATMCGYCTPGFVMSLTALLKKNPHPTEAEIRTACSGNLCRCGTQARMIQAALKVAHG